MAFAEILENSEFVSLVLTIPAVLFAFLVLFLWGKEAWKSFRTPKKEKTSIQWLILGIFLGFAGYILDSIYWFHVWTMIHLDMPLWKIPQMLGAVSNIFFRQTLGMVSAYCHIQSYIKTSPNHKFMENYTWGISIILGFSYAVLLYYIRNAPNLNIFGNY